MRGFEPTTLGLPLDHQCSQLLTDIKAQIDNSKVRAMPAHAHESSPFQLDDRRGHANCIIMYLAVMVCCFG